MGQDFNETVICACYSPEHQLHFSAFDDGIPEGYIQVFLREYRFWRRLWRGLKYILGYKCKFGHFDEFVFDVEQANKIKDLMEQFLENNKNA